MARISSLDKKDPVMVTAMRDACHQNLYSIANSAGMNGVGPETKVKIKDIAIVSSFRTAAIAFWVLFLWSMALWIGKRREFKQTEIYKNYQDYKAKK